MIELCKMLTDMLVTGFLVSANRPRILYIAKGSFGSLTEGPFRDEKTMRSAS
jgi:hypothetical protein